MRPVRLSPWFVRGAAIIWYLALPSAAIAQENAVPAPAPQITAIPLTLSAAGIRESLDQPQIDSTPTQSPFGSLPAEKPRRPGPLLPLYGSFVALQGMDFHSTRRALGSGSGREANPAMREVVNNSAAFLAVKAGATAGVIWASEKMWKKNRKGAVIFAAVVNAAMAAIVANNYRQAPER